MTRRQFGRRLVAAAAACLVGVWRAAGAPALERVRRAVAGGRFPGRVIPLDPKQVARSGRWLG